MHVSVTIVGFRNAADIAECLGALERSTHQDFDVVICENGGAAAYAALTKVVPAKLTGGQVVMTIEASHNMGFAGGTNLCIKTTPNADAWWILNPDTLPCPDAMAGMVKRLEAGDCEAVGSTVRLGSGLIQSYGGCWQKWIGRPVAIGIGSQPAEQDRATIEWRQNFLNGASMLVGRRFIEAVGYMREDYFLYCEEVEWCLRGLRHGLRLGFAPDAVVVHLQSKTMDNFKTKRPSGALVIYLCERNRILLTRDLFPLLLPTVIVAGIPLIAYKYWLRRGWRHFVYGMRGYCAGILGKRGVPAWLEN